MEEGVDLGSPQPVKAAGAALEAEEDMEVQESAQEDEEVAPAEEEKTQEKGRTHGGRENTGERPYTNIKELPTSRFDTCT